MNRARSIAMAALMSALGVGVLAMSPLALNVAHAQTQPQPETLRPEIGKPLQAAQELLKSKRYPDALAKVAEAESVPNRTAYENYMINRVRASVAALAGDDQLAIRTFETVLESDRMPASERMPFVQALISLYYKAANYPKTIEWIERYYKEGGTEPKMRSLLIRSYYESNDLVRTTQELRADIQADEKAGRVPAEESLKMLLACASKQNDKVAYVDTLEKFVAYYPKKEYWTELLNRVSSKPNFTTETLLDLYRLKRTLGQMGGASDYSQFFELATVEGYPAEAKIVIDEGLESGVLNLTMESGRYKRLRDLANKSAAEDAQSLKGDVKPKTSVGLLKTGYAYVTNGQFDKGLPMMEQALKQGGLKHPENAKLALGYAYYLANRKEQAAKVFQNVQGNDGSAEVGRYWVLFLSGPEL